MDVNPTYMSYATGAMREVLAKHFGIEAQQLSTDQPIASLGLDSLGFVEYVFEIEKALKITLPDVPRDVQTVGALIAFIAGEVQRQTPNAAAP